MPREEVLGWRVVYPDGTVTPDNALFLSALEAKTEVRRFGGGAIKRVVRTAAPPPHKVAVQDDSVFVAG